MARPSPIYALPLPVPSQTRARSLGKRKRSWNSHIEDEGDVLADTDAEYSAIVTPEGRAQRRLAGFALDDSLPSLPFPHAPQSQNHSTILEEQHTGTAISTTATDHIPTNSIRNNHLAAMMSILHKCLEQRDYVRASNAMAMLLRTENLGKIIDLRHAELWGIAAEILLRFETTTNDAVSRQAFERSKHLYDKLSIQHPWHRSWPNAINAQDFKTALFSLWIGMVHMESKKIREQDNDSNVDISSVSLDQELQSREWELGQAENISKEMDSLTGTVPFIDDLELIKLRAMVALWIADLIDTVDSLVADLTGDVDSQGKNRWLEISNSGYHETTQNMIGKAAASRNLAKTLFQRLRIDIDNSTAEEENNNNNNNNSDTHVVD